MTISVLIFYMYQPENPKYKTWRTWREKKVFFLKFFSAKLAPGTTRTLKILNSNSEIVMKYINKKNKIE